MEIISPSPALLRDAHSFIQWLRRPIELERFQSYIFIILFTVIALGVDIPLQIVILFNDLVACVYLHFFTLQLVTAYRTVQRDKEKTQVILFLLIFTAQFPGLFSPGVISSVISGQLKVGLNWFYAHVCFPSPLGHSQSESR